MEIKNKVGRPGNEIIYKKVDYNDKKYVVGSVKYNDTTLNFIILAFMRCHNDINI